MKKSSILSLLRKKSTIDYLKQHQISHIWLAGSFARNQHTDESDIDIVYEFDDAIDMKDR
jgi:predicted nucleotidyltransferase